MKTPTISRNDGTNFSERVNKLRTPKVGGGSITWVPDDETRCTSLTVKANGTYTAESAGKYGYDYVTVSVPGSSVTGKDPKTGKTVTVSTDPETGDLVETVIPTEIRVITPPTNPYGVYPDGSTISTEGMVVKAYDSDGEELQTVPVGELTINPTVAAYDEDEDMAWVTADIDTSPVPQPFPTVMSAIIDQAPLGGEIYIELNAYKPMVFIENTDVPDGTGNVRYEAIIATDTQGELVEVSTRIHHRGTSRESVHYDEHKANNKYTYNNKTVYYANIGNNSYFAPGAGYPVAGGWPVGNIPFGRIAWALLYGESTARGSQQSITVSWPRPGDGAVLETTFAIRVAPRGGSGDK